MQGTEIPDQKMFLVWSTASYKAFNFGAFMERMTTSHANSEARVTTQYWGYRELLADEVETVYGGGDGAGGEPVGCPPGTPDSRPGIEVWCDEYGRVHAVFSGSTGSTDTGFGSVSGGSGVPGASGNNPSAYGGGNASDSNDSGG